MTDQQEQSKQYAATDRLSLEHQIMSPNIPKNEREHWAAREINRLREALQRQEEMAQEIETLRMQLAACGVAVMANTKETVERFGLDKDNPAWSNSYARVRLAVDNEIKQREEIERLKAINLQNIADAQALQGYHAGRDRELMKTVSLAGNRHAEIEQLKAINRQNLADASDNIYTLSQEINQLNEELGILEMERLAPAEALNIQLKAELAQATKKERELKAKLDMQYRLNGGQCQEITVLKNKLRGKL